MRTARGVGPESRARPRDQARRFIPHARTGTEGSTATGPAVRRRGRRRSALVLGVVLVGHLVPVLAAAGDPMWTPLSTLYLLAVSLPLALLPTAPGRALGAVVAVTLSLRVTDLLSTTPLVDPFNAPLATLVPVTRFGTVAVLVVASIRLGVQGLRASAGPLFVVAGLCLAAATATAGRTAVFGLSVLLVVSVAVLVAAGWRRARHGRASGSGTSGASTVTASDRAVTYREVHPPRDRRLAAAPGRPAAAPASLVPTLLQHWPAVATLLGLLLFVPTYTAYEFFYGSLGVSPDEIGIGYVTVLSRETTWLVSSVVLLVAIAAALAASLGIALRPGRARSALQRHGLPAPAEPHLRWGSALAGLSGLLLLGQLVLYQVFSVPAYEVKDGVPSAPEWGSFFKARVDLVELDWVEAPGPAGVPRRALYLGQGGGMSVFWDPRARTALRLPAGAVAMTTVPVEPRRYSPVQDDDGPRVVNGALGLRLSSSAASVTSAWPFGVRRAQEGEACSDGEWDRAIAAAVDDSRYDGVLVDWRSADAGIVYLLPGYEILNVELVRAGAPLDEEALARLAPESAVAGELRAAAAGAQAARRELTPPCPPAR